MARPVALPQDEPERKLIRLPLRRPRRRRWVAALLALAVLATGTLTVAWLTGPSPVDPKGLVLERLRAAGGSFVELADVSTELRLAVVATEDERFFRHHGIDVIGMARAAAYDVSHLSASQGASTITEQLAKILYLDGNDRSPWRKLQDALVALRIESHLSKDQILELYLNAVYFGEGAYGIGAASQRYFGLPPSRLDLAQASLLAGLIQAPSAYDPFGEPLAARYRQADVLASMVRNGYATETEGERVLEEPLRLAGGRTLAPLSGVSLAPGPHFSGPEMEAGLALLGLGLFGLILARRRWRVPARVGGWLMLALGALLIARSMRVG